MGLVTYHQFCWNYYASLGGLLFGLRFLQWTGSFFAYVWGSKKDSSTLVVASQSLLGRRVEHLKFCLFTRMVEFYLGRGATWVVGLVCF